MHNKKIIVVALILGLCIIEISGLICVVMAETWETTYSFYVPNSYGTFMSDNFTCTHASWRIAYSFGIPDDGAWLTITVYNATSNMTIDEFRDGYQWRNLNWSGTRNFGGIGTFYMVIKAENLYLYPSIEVQEDINSIPEFPSFLIMPLFMIATLLAVIVYKEKTFNVTDTISLLIKEYKLVI